MTNQPRRYRLTVMGHEGRLIGTRYVLQYQAIGRIAALALPLAEAERLYRETSGNTTLPLKMAADALQEQGYDTLMVLPANTQFVELTELNPLDESAAKVFDEARRLELESAALMVAAHTLLSHIKQHLQQDLSPTSKTIRFNIDTLQRELATRYVEKG